MKKKMKKLENKKIELTFNEKEQGSLHLAIVCLNQIPQGGLSPQEMAKVVKVINIIEDVEIGKNIELEDADFELLKTKVNSTKWNMIHKDIVSFTEYINSIK